MTNMFGLLVLFTVISPALTNVYMMSAPNVTITYPVMEQKYNHNSREQWTFDYKTVLNFTVVVTKMSIEKSNGCKADFLGIVDDRINYRSRILCGQGSSNFTVYNGLTYHFHILFQSDRSWNDFGFSLQVTGYPVNNSKLCEMMHHYFLITSAIMTYVDRYPAFLNCSWEISAPKGKTVSLSFRRFDIEYSGPECPYDRVEVWNSPNNNPKGELLGRFCGKHYPWIFNTNSNSIYIRFITDAVDNSNGFALEYNMTEISQPNQTIYNLYASPTIDIITLPLVEATSVLTWIIRTHPGFRIAIDFQGNEAENSLKMYDGPSHEFKGLIDYLALSTAGGKTVYSNGFYLTVDVNLPLNISTNLSYVYMSVNHMTFRTTGLTFSGEFDFYQTVRIPNVYHVLYFAYIVPPDKHPRCHINSGSTVIRQGPNTDDCAYTGIAFYHGTVSFENLIGPFCNIDKSYLSNILDKMVGSTSVTYVVMYDYSKKSTTTIYQYNVDCSAEKCRGFQIAENMFHTARNVRGKNFTLQAYTKYSKNYLKIFYKESNDDCVVIHLLPYKKNSTELTILLTGKFKYRICRQWGVKKSVERISSLNGSKYMSSENCTNYLISTDKTTELHESISTLYGWTKEFSILELGPVSDSLCPEVSCPSYQTTLATLGCGTLSGASSDCRLILTSPESSYRDSIWVLRIGLIVRYTKYPNRDGVMIISEIHKDNRSNVTTKISNFKIGTIRAFTYKSLPEVELEIYSLNLKHITMRFSQVKRVHFENSKRRYEPTCSDYNSSSYLFNIHERRTSWETANFECKKRGGYLVSINSQDELDFLKTCLEGPWETTFYGNNRGLIFIGLTDSSQVKLWA